MEYKDRRLPIPRRTLGDCAFRHHAYAKALHHKEIDAFQETSAADVEALISINTRLQQHDAAWGALLMAQSDYDVSEHEAWYERLGRWQEALDAYNKRQNEEGISTDTLYGRMRCLHALGEWEELARSIRLHWNISDEYTRRELAPMAAAAAWSLREWDAMEDYIGAIKMDSPDRAFYRAVLSIHKNQYPRAMGHISRARHLLDPELTSLIGDNNGRTYTFVSLLSFEACTDQHL